MKKKLWIVCCIVVLAAALWMTVGKTLGRATTLEAEFAVEVPFDETVEYIYVRTHALVVGSHSNIGDVTEPEQIREFLDLLREIELIDVANIGLAWDHDGSVGDPAERVKVNLLRSGEGGAGFMTDGTGLLQIQYNDHGANWYRVKNPEKLLAIHEFMERYDLFR